MLEVGGALNPMTGVLPGERERFGDTLRGHVETRAVMGTMDLQATGCQGFPGATSSWKREEASFSKPSEGTQLCGHLHIELLAFGTVRE